MTPYIAFLRGVSPMNARMSELKHCFASAGFAEVRTILSSGNVAFASAKRRVADVEAEVESALLKGLGRTFYTIVRPVDALKRLIAEDPFAAFDVPAEAKRVVTFLRHPPADDLLLPAESEGVRVLAVRGCDVFTVYVRNPRGAVFMTVIQKAFGAKVTTRTWETVKRCAR